MGSNTITPEQAVEILAEAKALHRKGQIDKANMMYLQVLDQFPEDVEATRLRAVVYLEKGYHQLAEKLLQNALSLDASNASIYNNLGNLYHVRKEFQLAIKSYQRALEINPNFAAVANNLGNSWKAIKEIDKARAAYEQALSLDPGLAEAWNNLGNALLQGAKSKEAEHCIKKALEINANYKDAWNNLGSLHMSQGKREEALDNFNAALAIDRHDANTLNNKGNLLLSKGLSDEAKRCFRLAIAANKHLAKAWNGLGCAHRVHGELSDAENCFKKSIEKERDNAEAWNNLGLTLAELSKHDAAIAAYNNALEIRPNYTECHSNLLMCLSYHPDIHEKTLFEAHQSWAATHQHYPSSRTRNFSNPSDERIHLGFVSADFRRHPIAYFLLPVLKNIDRTKFLVTCYSSTQNEDDLSEHLYRHCESWIRCNNASDTALTERIQQDKVDILFDLSGHTAQNRLAVFASKPAALQITWLGYPATTGVDAIDYILSDTICLPDFMHWQFSERVLFLPNSRLCYAPPSYAPPIAELPALQNGYITFGSFNNPIKFNQTCFSVWAEILKQCENSRLVLSWKTLSDPTVSENIRNTFSEQGVEAHRITLLDGQRKHLEVLADYQKLDIALDTLPFSGGLTTCEALWMGVPVVTLADKKPASRQSASMLAEVDLDGLISFGKNEYVDRAVMLARDITSLTTIRESLRKRISASSLGNGNKFCREFETVMLDIHSRRFAQQHADARDKAEIDQ